MSNLYWRIACAIPVTFLIGGCAAVPLEEGRTHVTELVHQRAPAFDASAVAPDGDASVSRDAQLEQWLAQPLTMESAQRIALLRNPRLQARYAELGISAADVFEAGRLRNPSLNLSWLLPLGTAQGSKVGASAGLDFAGLLMRGAGRRIADAGYASTQHRVAADVMALLADAQQAWLECVAATQRLAVRRSNDEAAMLAAELAQQYQQAGNISQLVLQVQRAEASQARIEMHAAEMALADARARLQQVLGLPAAQSSWRLPQALPQIPEQDAAQVSSALTARALEQRLDLSAARRHLSAMEQQGASTRRFRFVADANAGAAFDREGNGDKRLGPQLALGLPLFQQGQGAVTRAEARILQARAQVIELEVAAQAQVQQHLAKLQSARAQVRAFQQGLIPQREAVVAELTSRANFMLVDAFAVLMARQQAYAAEAGYVDALLRYWTIEVELLRATGSRRDMEESR